MRYLFFLLALSATLLASCVRDHESSARSASSEADAAVIAAALEDFANWKDVTFGELEGVLELESSSSADPHATVGDIKALAPEISGQLDDEIVSAFIVRNRSPLSMASLFSGSRWARPQPPGSKNIYRFGPPDGAKAVGSLTLPGYSADGSKALIQIHHSWSIHGAVVTYVLSKNDGTWRVVARDQAVFL